MASTFDNELIIRDLPKALFFFNDMKEQVADVATSVQRLLFKVKNGEFAKSQKGISLLELKCHLLLNYLINLTYIALKKSYGRQIDNDEAILRLAELRTVLEKIRPFEQKLKYHIDKVIKAASGNENDRDPLKFSANPNNLIGKENVSSNESEGEEGSVTEKKDKVYVPPKLSAVHYYGDVEETAVRKQQLIQRARAKALKSSIIQELKSEYYDGPEEIKEVSYSTRSVLNEEAKRREQYEEDNFVRLNVSKKEKRAMKKMQLGINDVTHFGDVSALIDPDFDSVPHKKKKMSNKKTSKSIKKFQKKRR